MKALFFLLALLSLGSAAPLALAQPAMTTDTVASSGYWTWVYNHQLRRYVWTYVPC